MHILDPRHAMRHWRGPHAMKRDFFGIFFISFEALFAKQAKQNRFNFKVLNAGSKEFFYLQTSRGQFHQHLRTNFFAHTRFNAFLGERRTNLANFSSHLGQI